jgi:hypothetical protein
MIFFWASLGQVTSQFLWNGTLVAVQKLDIVRTDVREHFIDSAIFKKRQIAKLGLVMD